MSVVCVPILGYIPDGLHTIPDGYTISECRVPWNKFLNNLIAVLFVFKVYSIDVCVTLRLERVGEQVVADFIIIC